MDSEYTNKSKLAWAIKNAFRQGYSFKNFFVDIKAGLTVGIVAIPLGMALGIASGAAPQNRLYTVVIAGILIALLGGSRVQISGPTAAFLAGIILVILGLMRLAEVIQYIPHPVTTGFTDMTIGVGVGVGLASLLFIRRISSLTHSHIFDHDQIEKEIALVFASDSIKKAVENIEAFQRLGGRIQICSSVDETILALA